MNGEMILLEKIVFTANSDRLRRKLRINAGSSSDKELESILSEAEKIIRPSAVYFPAYIEKQEEDCVVIDNVLFHSRVLAVNLKQAYRVFPYLVTCGQEAEDWHREMKDMLQHYWADVILQMALHVALRAMEMDIQARYSYPNMASMSPGRLSHWPIEEQAALFELLGEAPSRLGVRLLESFLMTPTKTLSGIRYPTEESFESCQLCPRENCFGRKAPYVPDLFVRKYA